MIVHSFKQPFAIVKENWPFPDAIIVWGKRKYEIRRRREEDAIAQTERVWSEHRMQYILLLDFYLVRFKIEWVGRKWHAA